jgi:hypothetical protein
MDFVSTTPSLSLDAQLACCPSVLLSEVAGEAILLDQSRGVYYGLDEVGTAVWTQLVRGGATLGGIHQKMLADYDVSADRLMKDLTELLNRLEALELVEISSSTP